MPKPAKKKCGTFGLGISHTPGPWVVHTFRKTGLHESPSFKIYTDNGKGNGVHIEVCEGRPEAEANARVMLQRLRCLSS